MNAVSIRGVSKTFAQGGWRAALGAGKSPAVRALDGVSLEVGAGEVFGILGPNGAGKTTLIKILATLILPDAGGGSVCGWDLAAEAQKVRSKIGLVSANERSFYWRLSGRQNLDFFASLWGLKGREKARRIAEVMDISGISDKADAPVMKYSSGQQQRLALARALLPDPEVLLMDEPTRSLDPSAASEFRRFARQELAGTGGKTLLWCTHNLAEAREVCGRLAVIHKGRVRACGSIAEIRALIPGAAFFRLRVDRVPEAAFGPETMFNLEQIVKSNGHIEIDVHEKPENIPYLLAHLIEKDVKVFACTPVEPDLEQVFARLTGEGQRAERAEVRGQKSRCQVSGVRRNRG